MLGCLLVIERNVRKLGRAGLADLTGGLRAQRRAARHLRRAGPRLARSLPRATTPDVARWATPPRRRRGSRGCTVSQLRYWSRSGLVAPTGDRRRRTRSAISSRCASCGRCSTPACRRPRVHAARAVGARVGRRPRRACGSSPTAATCGRATTTARSSTRCAPVSSRCSSRSTARGRRRRRGARVRRRARRVRRAADRTRSDSDAARSRPSRGRSRRRQRARAR